MPGPVSECFTTGDRHRAVFHCAAAQGFDTRQLPGADHGGEVCVVLPQADAEPLGHGDDGLDHLVIDLALHQQPRHRRTDLAGIEENARLDAGQQLLAVCIGEGDRRGLAPQLHHTGNRKLRGIAQNRLARWHGTGEHDLVDSAMADQVRADFAAAAANQVDRDVGQAGLGNGADQHAHAQR
ncbi:hypothetical protein D9M71_640610 [compost metagenome]